MLTAQPAFRRPGRLAPGLLGALAVREVAPADTALIADLLGRLSERTRQLRYFTARPLTPDLARHEAAQITRRLAGQGAALIATVSGPGGEEAVALAELVRLPGQPAAAEVAVLVRDDYQARGVGRLLFDQLIAHARRLGLSSLHGTLLAHNQAMLRLIRGLEAPHDLWYEAGDLQLAIALPA